MKRPKGNPEEITPSKDQTRCRWSWTMKSRSVLWKETGLWKRGRGGWEWYLSLDWCFVVAWWVLGCWGSGRGPECRRCWAAELQPTEAARVEGRAKWLSYPGDCKHTTSLNVSVSVEPLQPDGWEARGTFGLGPALPVQPDVHVRPHTHRQTSNYSSLWQERELSGHVLSWMKLAESTLVAKLVGTFSVCMQLISLSPGFICTAACLTSLFPLFFIIFFLKLNIQEGCLLFSVNYIII